MERKTVLTYVAFAVCTVLFAAASAWPFLTAWRVRYSPAYLASHAWVMESASVGELVGPNRHTENDTFPKGGAEGERDGARARFEHKLVGDTDKAKVAVILERTGGSWRPVRAARETPEKTWEELELR